MPLSTYTGVPAARPRRKPRGYLLIEVMMGGVLAASILGFMTVSIVTSRNVRAKANKSVVAEQLLQERVADVAALGYAVTAGALPASPEALIVGGQSFTRTTTITSGSQTMGSMGTTVNYKDVAISVDYAFFSQIESASTSIRVFEP